MQKYSSTRTSQYGFRAKKRTMDALIEVEDFLLNSASESVYEIDLQEYHGNIQWYGLRNEILREYPELIVLTSSKDTKLLIIKTCLDVFSKGTNKKYFNELISLRKKSS